MVKYHVEDNKAWEAILPKNRNAHQPPQSRAEGKPETTGRPAFRKTMERNLYPVARKVSSQLTVKNRPVIWHQVTIGQESGMQLRNNRGATNAT